jgi:hypothetical protein
MLTATMNLDGIVDAAPNVLETITRELFNKADAAMRAGGESQLTACLRLGLRSASIMHGMARVLDLHTLDAFDTLNRAAIEAKDLLMHFRFNDQDTRKKIGYWFAGAKDNAWKADHARLDHFLTKQVSVLENVDLGAAWSKMSVLAHPTTYATDNSSAVLVNRLTGRLRAIDTESLVLKRADYVVGIARLFMATHDLPGWIPLGLNLANVPDCRAFVINAELVAGPLWPHQLAIRSRTIASGHRRRGLESRQTRPARTLAGSTLSNDRQPGHNPVLPIKNRVKEVLATNHPEQLNRHPCDGPVPSKQGMGSTLLKCAFFKQ